jgi:DNA-binding MarR family transcriptional regulator
MSQPPLITAAAEGMLNRPGSVPLPGLLDVFRNWFETRHLELMTQAGFDDVRRAHNAVFINVPAEGIRLTDLAMAAGVSKQTMGELVDELVERGYFVRKPDPTDGRAKLIKWAERGLQSHETTMRVFATIEDELSDLIGPQDLEHLRVTLTALVDQLRGGATVK